MRNKTKDKFSTKKTNVNKITDLNTTIEETVNNDRDLMKNGTTLRVKGEISSIKGTTKDSMTITIKTEVNSIRVMMIEEMLPARPRIQQNDDRKQQRSWGEKSDIQLSKALSFILRHGAERQGYKMIPGGFLYVDEILKGQNNLRDYDLEDVKRIVETNSKKRFHMEPDKETGKMKIRTNQGHRIEVEDLELKPLLNAKEVSMVIHGTYFSSWEKIKHTGLSRMGRNHIHFVAGEPGENGVISGMRQSCEVMIFINLETALADRFRFFQSANNVILCAGNEDGVVPPKYFVQAVQRNPRQRMKRKEEVVEITTDTETSIQTKDADTQTDQVEDFEKQLKDQRKEVLKLMEEANFWKSKVLAMRRQPEEEITQPSPQKKRKLGKENRKIKSVVYPIQHFVEQEINNASASLVSKHQYPMERVLMQRHRVRIVPVTVCRYKWNDTESDFIVYGLEKKVHAPDYPQQNCCGCSVL
ncbi:TRPT1 [Mytilus coruscus]|uniref:2'-phosphotransferase n=1 Tax=Mytilus coruscus TaxID=42192 RepID=A0A6J8BDW8_MYTCO|nr:TRPT1 [Mytilus coruscus]